MGYWDVPALTLVTLGDPVPIRRLQADNTPLPLSEDLSGYLSTLGAGRVGDPSEQRQLE